MHHKINYMEKIMIKKILVGIAMLCMAMGMAFAQVDVNKADQAALDSVKGIGPTISKRIVDERNAHGPFKDWGDFEKRVKGVGDKKAAALSQSGLTVNGQPMSNVAAPSSTGAKKATGPMSGPESGEGKTGMRTEPAAKSEVRAPNPFTKNPATSAGKPSSSASSPAKQQP
jgi:competence protein ComEA